VIPFERRVKFEEVDAANIVFFARFVTYAHEAMEHFFDHLEGGYAGLILGRRIGFPAVHVEIDFKAPARYGDTLRIETEVARIGNRSAVLWYRMLHASSGSGSGSGSGALACDLKHTIVSTDLVKLSSLDMPADVRALLTEHLAPA
jgi:4-hydroxybenzoyl-CoA thioesterase